MVATGRNAFTDEAYRAFAREAVQRFSRRPIDEAQWPAFAEVLFFVTLDLEDPQAFPRLGARLDTIGHGRGLPGNRVYYLAVPSSLFKTTVEQLARARFVGPPDTGPDARVIVEKPIGLDLTSAMAINDAIARVFDERRIYRIDHYLEKRPFRTFWSCASRTASSSRSSIKSHRPCADHRRGRRRVGTRSGYYDQAGAARHGPEPHAAAPTLIAMEPPYSLEADVVRDEKLEVLKSLRPIEGGQSTPRWCGRNTRLDFTWALLCLDTRTSLA